MCWPWWVVFGMGLFMGMENLSEAALSGPGSEWVPLSPVRGSLTRKTVFQEVSLPAGTAVKVWQYAGGRYQVSLADGRAGWVPAAHVRMAGDFAPLVEVEESARITLKWYAYARHGLAGEGEPFYGKARCLVLPEVRERLVTAAKTLHGRKLALLDCYRPYYVQYRMYEMVRELREDWRTWVAEPVERTVTPARARGSGHNFGRAVDVTLAEADGRLVDMGSPFDEFSERSHFDHFSSNSDTRFHRHRMELRRLMESVGFVPYDSEWWHFSIPATAEMKLLNYPL